MPVDFIADEQAPPQQTGPTPTTGVDFFPDDAATVSFVPDGPVDVERSASIAGTIGNIGASLRRGWLRSQLADELTKDPQAKEPEQKPNAETVVSYQSEIRKVMPSPEYMVTMDDSKDPKESFAAFASNPVGVLGEMMGESFSSMAHQLINKAPARVAIGAGAGATFAGVAGQAGPQVLFPEEIFTVPAGAGVGARAGLAQATAAGSYTLEMSDGILKSLEDAGVNIGDPEQLRAAFEDKDRMQLAKEFAQKKAIPVAAFDLASALIAGRFASKQTASALKRVARGGLETLVQSLFGMGGEASGQVLQQGEITSPRSVMAEGVGQTVASAPEVIAATRFRSAEAASDQAARARGQQAAPTEPPPAAQTAQEPAYGFGDVEQESDPIVTPPPREDVEGVTKTVEIKKPQDTPVDRDGDIPIPTPLPDPPSEVKPRAFGERAKQSDTILAGAKLKIGTEYGVTSDAAAQEAARNWINENGLDAALARIRRLNETKVIPSAVDGAIGQEAIERASAIENPAMEQYQADMADYLSELGTASGQFVNTFKYLGRMTPVGIVRYAERQIERQIGDLPQDKQKEVLAQREEVVAIRGELGNLRRAFSSRAISDTKYGGETIQSRIARRLGGQKQAEPALMALRDAISSGLNITEAQEQASKVLQDAGLSQSEAASVGGAAARSFYSSMKEARKDLVLNRMSTMASQQRAVQQLIKDIDRGEINDADLMGRISQIKGVPALTKDLEGRLKTLTKEYQSAEDPEVKMAKAYQIHEEVAGIMPASVSAQMQSWTYLAQLLFPLTWIVNVGGNMAAWGFNVAKDSIINGVFDPAVRIFSKEKKRTADVDASIVGLSAAGYGAAGAAIGTFIAPGPGTLAGLSIGSVFGAASGASGGGRVKAILTPIMDMKKGYDFAKKMYPQDSRLKWMRQGASHLRAMSRMTSQNKYTETDVRDATRRMYSGPVGRAFESTLSVAMGAFDRMFFMAQYNASLNASINAAKANGEWTGAPTPDMEEAARTDALSAIYQDKNFISRAMSQIRKAANFDKQFGLGTSLLMFTQVVGSIAKKGIVNMSPIGFIQPLYRGMRGILFATSGGRRGARFDRAAFNKEFTEAMLGSGVLFSPGYYLAKLGVVTAGPESDDRLEAMRRASGFGKYSINITALRRVLLSGNWVSPQPTLQGDVIVPYAWAQPIAITFAAGAEMAQIQRAKTLEGIKKGEGVDPSVVALSVLTASKSLQDLGLLSGLSSFFSSYQYNNKNWIAAMAETALNMPSMFVPQAVRKFAQWNDNTIRETRGRVEFMEQYGISEPMVQRAFAQLAAQTPGLSKKFPPRFDLMGAAQERYQYEGNSFVNLMFNPIMVKRVQQDPVLSEIARLVNATGDTTIIPNEPNSRKIVLNGKPYELTNDQLAAYKFYLGNYTMSIYRQLASNPEYSKLPDSVRIDVFNKYARDVNAAVKAVVLGNDAAKLTTDQQAMTALLLRSPLAQTPVPQFAAPPVPR